MSHATAIQGTVAEGFERVREEFAAVAADEADPGAQLAVYLHGRQVVDLWAGDGVSGSSLHALFSSGKGAAHLVVALLVQDGVLDLDATVASYWPEFAAEGKGELTLRDLLAHRAGLIGVDGGFSTAELADDRLIARRLATQRPYWRPGTAYGYHAFVIGALTGEVVRRVTGRSLQQVYEERVRAPYGLDFHLGLPEALEPRYVPVRPLPARDRAAAGAGAPAPDSLTGIAFNLNAAEPTDLADFANTRAVRALGPSSSGSVGNARGLARMYAAVISEVDGRAPLLRPDTLAEFTRPHGGGGVDLVTGERDHFLLGFEAQGVRYPFLGPDAFGHSGAVGAQSFADPRSGVAYGYTRRRFSLGGGGGAAENHRLAAAVLRAATDRP
ncbi:serine hydrolase domain-containing protein [Allostreptomyces psammosilenae]|uniref:CubicO group peptidase (Beta-lactamase class C family) n=1 Tax=Allostreptomyces psammosilenae TaxID=1892865 RepID=A0A853A6Y8_9ACTN|nr:serine hydrolase domain-containing protein [Allostreptomyces psammosilenae]NYI06441.1 CubicO group peptidase (beta-lactamase class C family) [Allostreptomyces psammosilenae]